MAFDRRSLIAEAKRRLGMSSNAGVMRRINNFVREHGFGEEVTIALRMLDSEMLAEFFQGRDAVRQQLSKVRDQSALILTLINKLDPKVEALVREQQRASQTKPTTSVKKVWGRQGRSVVQVSVANVDTELLAKADKRVDDPKTPLTKRNIQRFVKFWGFGDDVELSLNLLQAHHVREFFAAEDDIVKKFKGEKKPHDVVLQLLEMMDPEIAGLRAVFQSQSSAKQPQTSKWNEQNPSASSRPNQHKLPKALPTKRKQSEQQASSSSWSDQPNGKRADSSASSWSEPPLGKKARKPAHLEQGWKEPGWKEGGQHDKWGGKWKEPEWKEGGQHDKWEEAKGEPARKPAQLENKLSLSSPFAVGKLVQQAEERLQRNKSSQSLESITSFTRRHKLGDECTLALGMLAPPMLKEFMAGQWEIAQKLGKCEDPSTVVLALVAGLDAEAGGLAQSLSRVDAKRAPSAPSAQPTSVQGALAGRSSALGASGYTGKNEPSAQPTTVQRALPAAASAFSTTILAATASTHGTGHQWKSEPKGAKGARSSAGKHTWSGASSWNSWEG